MSIGRDQFLQQIVTEQRDLSLLVGSGLSMAAGLPGWAELLNAVAKMAGLDPITEADTDNYLYCQRIADQLGGGNRETGLAVMKQEVCRLLKTSSLHADLSPYAILPRMGALNLMTLNYDKLIQRAFAEAQESLQECMPFNIPQRYAKDTRLLYLHGCLDVPDNIVISRDDVTGLMAGKFSAILSEAKSWYRDTAVLHVGVGFGDPPMIKRLIEDTAREAARGQTLPHYALVTSSVSPDVQQLLNQLTGVIFCQVDRGEVTEVLEQIAHNRTGKGKLDPYPAEAIVETVTSTIQQRTKALRLNGPQSLSPTVDPINYSLVEAWLDKLSAPNCKQALIGPPGVGKTTLLQTVAHRVGADAENFKGGVFYVNDPSQGPDNVIFAMLDELDRPGRSVSEAGLPDWLSKARPVLILDNLSRNGLELWRETLTEGVFRDLPVVVASQNRDLALGDDLERSILEGLDVQEACALFCRHHSCGQDLDQDALRELLTVPSLLGGLPGAITVAARTIDSMGWSVARFKERMEEERKTARQRNDMPEQKRLLEDPDLGPEEKARLSAERLKAFSYFHTMDVAFSARFSGQVLDADRARRLTAILGEYANHQTEGDLVQVAQAHLQTSEEIGAESAFACSEQDLREVARELRQVGLVALEDDTYRIPHPVRIYAEAELKESAEFYPTRRNRLVHSTMATDEASRVAAFEAAKLSGALEAPADGAMAYQVESLDALIKRSHDFAEIKIPFSDQEALRAQARASMKLGEAHYRAGNYRAGAEAHADAAELFARIGDLSYALKNASEYGMMCHHIVGSDQKAFMARWYDIAERGGKRPTAAYLKFSQSMLDVADPIRKITAYLPTYMLDASIDIALFWGVILNLADSTNDLAFIQDHIDKAICEENSERNRSICRTRLLENMLDSSDIDWERCAQLLKELQPEPSRTGQDVAISARFIAAKYALYSCQTAKEEKALFKVLETEAPQEPEDVADQWTAELATLRYGAAMRRGTHRDALRAAKRLATTRYGSTSVATQETDEYLALAALLTDPQNKANREAAHSAAQDARRRHRYVSALHLEAAHLFAEQDRVGLHAICEVMKFRDVSPVCVERMIDTLMMSQGSKTKTPSAIEILQRMPEFAGALPRLFETSPTRMDGPDGTDLRLRFPKGEYPQYEATNYVTFAQFCQFLEASAFPRPALWPENWPIEELTDHPVTGLTYVEAQAYCRWFGMFLPRQPEEIIEAESDLSEKAARKIVRKSLQFSDAVEVDRKEFAGLLAGSLSLSVAEKIRVIDAAPMLSQFQIDELIKVFQKEKEKFVDLRRDHSKDIVRLEKKSQVELMDIRFRYSSDKLLDPVGSHHAESNDQLISRFHLGLKPALPARPLGPADIFRLEPIDWRREVMQMYWTSENNSAKYQSTTWRNLLAAHRIDTGSDKDALEQICLSENINFLNHFSYDEFRQFSEVSNRLEGITQMQYDAELKDVAVQLRLGSEALEFVSRNELRQMALRVLMSPNHDDMLRENAYFLLLKKAVNLPDTDAIGEKRS